MARVSQVTLLARMKAILAYLLCVVSTFAFQNCSEYSDCVTCAGTKECLWCGDYNQDSFESNNNIEMRKCLNVFDSKKCSMIGGDSYKFEDTCAVIRPPSAIEKYLSNWMGNTLSIIGDLTILDLSLPGTHDTLTYNLSLTVSDGGIDGATELAQILHDYSDPIPDFVEDYIRQQAQTQDLDIIKQLNNGIRFIDGRMMYEYSGNDNEWYSLHFMQSMDTMMKYLRDIRSWIDSHQSEIIVLWLSKHGSTCDVGNEQYPNTSIAVKQQYWEQIVNVFNGVLTNFTTSPLNETTVSTLLSRNQRIVILASDYAELTNNSDYAMDACKHLNNTGGPSVTDEVAALNYERAAFSSAISNRLYNKQLNQLYLMSMATGVPGEQMWYAFKIKYLPYTNDDVYKCAAAFNIPNMTDWCPETLLDISNLENYYKQISIEESIRNIIDNVFPEGLDNVITNYKANGLPYQIRNSRSLNTTYGFPNAIYLNGFDVDGTIRTGTRVLWGANRNSEDAEHQTTSYSYSSTLILFNVLFGCYYSERFTTFEMESYCLDAIMELNLQRSKYPYERWVDTALGRWDDWPV